MFKTAQSTTQNQLGAWIELHTGHLTQNLRTLQGHSGQTDVLAVIKANAYGHGLREIAGALAGKVTCFGVATLREALELKENHPQTPVFLFGHLLSHEIPAALLGGITLSVSSLEKAQEISTVSESLGRKTSVHVKIDTGMGRIGCTPEEAPALARRIARDKHLRLEGIATHLAVADASGPDNARYTREQIARFASAVKAIKDLELDPKGLTDEAVEAAEILSAGK